MITKEDEEKFAKVHKEIYEIFKKYDLHGLEVIAVLDTIKHHFYQSTWENFKHYEQEIKINDIYS